jgi:SAM-dependent methyltransferase
MDLAVFQAQQRAVWASANEDGNEHWHTQVVRRLVDFVDLGLGQRVLDIGSGGLASQPARRRGAQATSVDPSSELITIARREAALAGFSDIEFHEAHATSLPFPDRSFDAVISPFGIQFEPEPTRVVAEMARVVKPNGLLGLALWEPSGALGRFVRLVSHFVPPAHSLADVFAWGEPDAVESLLSAHFVELDFRFGNIPVVAESPEAVWSWFLDIASPTREALLALPDEEFELLHLAAVEQFREHSDPGGHTHWPREYLLVRALRL